MPDYISGNDGSPRMGAEQAARMIVSVSEYELLDASSGDANATFTECRCISVDTEGIVKIDYKNSNDSASTTEVLYLPSGVFTSIRRVTKLYRYYTGTTDGTAKCYGSDGVAITNALKIRW